MLPVFKRLRGQPAAVSVDTYKADVARAALDEAPHGERLAA